ncbi:MAG: hypothetical protein JSV62_05020 [Promethearchaeota archaeon]|nr:MAG: hypothetical protein JSV62_05020 [Candidatus Lokiarchaeota archaeon]
MKDLTESLDDKIVKGLQHKVDEYTAKVNDLEQIIAKKDDELESLTKSNEELSNKLGNIDSEIYDLKKTVTISENQAKELKSEVEELRQKNEELTDELLKKENKIKELNEILIEKEKIIEEQKSKLDKTETELSSLKPETPTEYTSEERLICPSCGARGKDLRVEEDKSKVLGYVGHSPMYGKKNVCKKCSYEF